MRLVVNPECGVPGMRSAQSRLIDLWHLLRIRRPLRRRMLRVGRCADGGYVLCDDFEGVDAVLSFGIGNEVSFDLALARLGMTIYQFDHTVAGPPQHHERFRFHPIALGAQTGPGVISLHDVLALNPGHFQGDAILKFDVEGSEWESLRTVPADGFSRFRFIVGEFHWLGQAVREEMHAVFTDVFRSLLQTHSIIHLHANNACPFHVIENVAIPELVELTFYRNDRDDLMDYHGPLPCALDAANDPSKPDIILRV